MDDLVSLDAEMIRRTYELSTKIMAHYDRYEFSEVTQTLHHFCVDDLGSFYLDIIKDRQYTLKAESHARKSCQTALYWITDALVRWMSPILSFTAQKFGRQCPVNVLIASCLLLLKLNTKGGSSCRGKLVTNSIC